MYIHVITEQRAHPAPHPRRDAAEPRGAQHHDHHQD